MFFYPHMVMGQIQHKPCLRLGHHQLLHCLLPFLLYTIQQVMVNCKMAVYQAYFWFLEHPIYLLYVFTCSYQIAIPQISPGPWHMFFSVLEWFPQTPQPWLLPGSCQVLVTSVETFFLVLTPGTACIWNIVYKGLQVTCNSQPSCHLLNWVEQVLFHLPYLGAYIFFCDLPQKEAPKFSITFKWQ